MRGERFWGPDDVGGSERVPRSALTTLSAARHSDPSQRHARRFVYWSSLVFIEYLSVTIWMEIKQFYGYRFLSLPAASGSPQSERRDGICIDMAVLSPGNCPFHSVKVAYENTAIFHRYKIRGSLVGNSSTVSCSNHQVSSHIPSNLLLFEHQESP